MSKSLTSKASNPTPTTYSTLLTRVKQTLIQGQQRIEQERVRTYWETGKLIHDHILKHADRAEYGGKVILRLAEDLNINRRLLHYCIQFAKTYKRFPIVHGRAQFKWAHYRELLTISDDKKRSALEEVARRNNWTSDELGARITGYRPNAEKEETQPEKPLTPLRGQLYTYRLVERPQISAGDELGLLLDLGFGVYRNVDPRSVAQFSKDDIVESKPSGDSYRLSKTDRTSKDLFTYNAYVERVIDGDTLKVRIDLGFDTWHRETLRLRDIDCPEMDTKAGQEAKAFVQSLIKEASWIVVRSSRSDKYDRYLADIFVPTVSLRAEQSSAKQSQELYLNNLLLEKGYARRME